MKFQRETCKNFCRHCGTPTPKSQDRYNESCCLACAGLVPQSVEGRKLDDALLSDLEGMSFCN
jgi:hypothetical protein